MKRGLLAFLLVLALGAGVSVTAAAATQVIVTPSNQQGWSEFPPYSTTRDGGTVEFVADPTAPGSPNSGALELTTPLLPLTAKAQYMHPASTALSDVTELSYYTKQMSAPFAGAAPSYQLQVCLNGMTGATCNGFTTLVFEPYQNGVVVPTTWQFWDVDAGLFWSTRTQICTGGPVGTGVIAGFGGAPFYTLSMVKTMCPNAVVVAFGVNIGSNNPGYIVRTDLVNFNGTTYNFEPDATCREKANNKDKDKEKSNNKDKDKLPRCENEDSDDDEED